MNILKGTVIAAVVVILLGATLYPAIESYSDDSHNVIDVLIIDGQSNAEYGDSAVCNPTILNQEYEEVPSHNIYYYGTSSAPANHWDWSHKWGYAWAAFHIHNAYDYTNDKWKIGGYEPILGNTIAEKSGNDVLVINMAIGARTLSDLLPDGAYADYSWGVLDHALSQIKKTYDIIRMAGVVWIQGESDKDTSVSDYKTSFIKLMSSFEKYGANEFYLVHTREYYGGNSCIAQDELASTYSNVYMTTDIAETFTVDNGMLDPNAPIHYSQKGRDAIAFAIKDQIIIPVNAPSDGIDPVLYVIPIIFIVGLALSFIRIVVGRND